MKAQIIKKFGDPSVFEALAEFMLVDEKSIAKKPNALSMLESAALPLVSITAWEALFTKVNLVKTNHILIQGGGQG